MHEENKIALNIFIIEDNYNSNYRKVFLSECTGQMVLIIIGAKHLWMGFLH